MNKWVRRFLALITLVGSVYGLTASIFSIFELNATGGGIIAMVLAAIGVVFFLFGLLTGFWLLEGTPKAVMANSFFWLLQLPAVITAFFTYKVYAFGSMAFSTDPTFSGFGFPTNGAPLGAPESRFDLSMGSADDGISIGINLFALFMLVLLLFARGSKRGPGAAQKSGLFGIGKAAKLAGGAAAVAGGAVAASAKSATSAAGTAADLAGSAASDIADGVGAVAEGAIDVAGDVAGGAVDLAGSAVSGVTEGVGAVAGGAIDVAGDVAGGAVDLAGSAVSGVADGVGAVAGGAIDVAGNLGGNALDLAKDAVEIISETTDDAAEDIVIESKDS
ncbi:MAG: hypothetical protein L3J67_02345 [Hyphomicrobiaceae bacterium]|nr:hypothetical protein [Hyphomicrobiaceae bacterium]